MEQEEKYFLTRKISEKLKDILIDKNIVSYLRQSGSSGVTTGRIYKMLERNGVIGENDVTLQFNIDGANIFKSSRKSLWPIQVAVNELPYQIRRNNMILAGLWFGDGSS